MIAEIVGPSRISPRYTRLTAIQHLTELLRYKYTSSAEARLIILEGNGRYSCLLTLYNQLVDTAPASRAMALSSKALINKDLQTPKFQKNPR